MKLVPMRGRPISGTLTYRRSEYSFDFAPAAPYETAGSKRGTTSLVIDTLQIEVDVDTHRLLYVWGYHPFQHWITADLQLPSSTAGEVRLDLAYELQPGVSIALGAAKDWPTHFDPGSQLVRIGRMQYSADMAIEIADGVVVEIDDNELAALWLRPAFEG